MAGNYTSGAKQLTSYLDQEGGEFVKWNDIWAACVEEVRKAYMDGSLQKLRRAIDGFEMMLWGHADATYEIQLLSLENDIRIELEHNRNTINSDFNFLKVKHKILMSLIYRITQGETKVIEDINQSAIINEIATKLMKGIGQNLFITGATGSGKSWASGSLAEHITELTGQKFDAAKHVAFTPKQFLKIYNDEELTPHGSAIIFEEVTTSGKMNSRQTMSNVNMILSDIMQTIRFRRLAIIFNAPDLGGLDKPQRKLLHWWLKTEKLDMRSGVCTVKPHVIAVNQRDGDIYYQYPRFNRTEAVIRLNIEKPTKTFIDTYEPLQTEYKKKLGEDSEKKILEMDDEREEFLEDERIYVECRLAGESQKDCRGKVGRSWAWAKRVDTLAKKFGYKIPDGRGSSMKKK